jgi:aminoglycoside 6'-N-acetyltransferase I
MLIVDLAKQASLVAQTAELLQTGFADHLQPPWADISSALQEVRETLQPGRISRVALDEAGAAAGWIAGCSHYGGRVWELHPLVVRADRRGQGLGRALVADLEGQVCARGGLTLWVGTDDEDGWTSLGGAELYPDLLAHLMRLRNLQRHPVGFYLRLGFSLAGVVPDANGWGKPDILLAKRVGEP